MQHSILLEVDKIVPKEYHANGECVYLTSKPLQKLRDVGEVRLTVRSSEECVFLNFLCGTIRIKDVLV